MLRIFLFLEYIEGIFLFLKCLKAIICRIILIACIFVCKKRNESVKLGLCVGFILPQYLVVVTGWIEVKMEISYCVCFVASVREPCIEADLVKVLVPHLNSNNEEMLLNTGRAIGRICFDNCELFWQWWLSQQGSLMTNSVFVKQSLLNLKSYGPPN